MRNAAFAGYLGSLGLGLLVAMTGCEPVDDGSVNRNPGWNGELTDNVIDTDRPVFTDTDETVTVADGCAKTSIDAHNVLAANCGGCHDRGPASQGAPLFDFVMDDAKLKAQMWTRQGSVVRFLVPGDPDKSMIFVRAAMDQDMPPSYDVGLPSPPKITFSDASVLRQWIEKCMQ